MTPKVYSSYSELAAAQGDFVPMNGERHPESTDNSVAEAMAAAKTLRDFNTMYSGALDAAKAAEYGDYAAGEGVLKTEYATGARDGIVSSVTDVADELRDADEKREFDPNVTHDFAKKMDGVCKANVTVQKGVGLLTDAFRKKLEDEPVPPKTEQDAKTVFDYAKQAQDRRPANYSPERQNKKRIQKADKMLTSLMND